MNSTVNENRDSRVIARLQGYGCDTEGALRRIFNDEACYVELVTGYFAELDLHKLSQAVAAGDAEEAFIQAHAAKGVLANLGITPLLEPVCELTELFRAHSCAGATARLAEIARIKSELELLLRD